MIKVFKIVPIPGFCFKNIQKNKTIKLIKKVELPTVRPVFKDNPSDKTNQGEFPVDEINSKASPKPKQKRPRDKNKRVLYFGLKFRGLSELQDFFGIWFIFRKFKKGNIVKRIT